jgi:hypothetical protein
MLQHDARAARAAPRACEKRRESSAFPRDALWYASCFGISREEEGAAQKGALMQQLSLVFLVLLLVSLAAGIFISWDRRTGRDRRRSVRGGRRTADGTAANTTEPMLEEAAKRL